MEKYVFLQVSEKFGKKGGGITISLRGVSGGIGSLWDDQKFELTDIKHSSHWILATLLQKETKVQVRLFNIHATASYAEKEDCWNLLRDERSNQHDNDILVGDLNIILSQAKKKRWSLGQRPHKGAC